MSDTEARQEAQLAASTPIAGAHRRRSHACVQPRQNLKLTRADMFWCRPTPSHLVCATDSSVAHGQARAVAAQQPPPARRATGGRPQGPPKCSKCRRAGVPCKHMADSAHCGASAAPQSRPEPARGRVRSRSARVALSALPVGACSIRVHRRRRCVR